MGNFNRDDRSGGGGGSRFGKKSYGGGGGGGFRSRDSRPSEMHQATCSECGKPCEVPFRPTGSRPIFCSTCFGKQKSQESKGFGGGDRERNFDRPRFENKRRDDFRREPSAGDRGMEQLKQQLEIVNNKLERILKILVPPTPAEPVLEKKAPIKMSEETTVVKKEKKKKKAKKV